MSDTKPRRWKPYTPRWERAAGLVARSFVGTMCPCSRCGYPRIKGYRCTRCHCPCGSGKCECDD